METQTSSKRNEARNKSSTATAPAASGATTTEPIHLGNFADNDPEWVRLPILEKRWGIKRGNAYCLLHDGEIKGVCLRRRGSPTGIRLVSVASVRAYLQRQSEQPAFLPRKKDANKDGAE